MTEDQIRGRIAELQQKRDLLEREAVQLEQAARDKRAERDKVKSDLADLGKAMTDVATMNAAQQALAAANQAKAHAETQAAAVQQTLKDQQAALERTEQLNRQLEQRLANMDASTKPAE